MSFRTRVLLACALVVLVPVVAVGVGLRREVEERLRAGYAARVDALASVVEEDLAREAESIGTRLATLGAAIAADNRFRAALAGGGGADRAYVLDYAGEAMALTGLSVLQVQDPDGRIVSSGHFRNAFDVPAPELPRRLASLSGGAALTRVRTPVGALLALVRVDSVRVSGRRYHLVGGTEMGRAFLSRLSRDPELSVRLAHPGGEVRPGRAPSAGADSGEARALPFSGSPADREVAGGAAAEGVSDAEVTRTVVLPYVAPGRDGSSPGDTIAEARFEIAFDGAALRELRRSTNVWFAGVLAGALGLALAVAAWLSARVTRPLEALAAKTRRVDLDRLDAAFATGRSDEIGQLARLLDRMTERLRASARELLDAERRATLGEVARQVNHDIRNGLAPIRHVLRHLDEVIRDAPGALATVYEERRNSLASSVSYLETLAGTYERLSIRAGAGSADPSEVVRAVVEAASAGSPVPVRAETEPSLPRVRGDAVTVRRIVENLVTNARRAASGTGGGRVTVRATVNGAVADEPPERSPEPPGAGGSSGGAARARGDRSKRGGPGGTPSSVRVVVEDTGRGMTEEERQRAFEDFFTTTEGGTGLGLSVVRRLVRDLGGSVELESEPGRGTRVTVILPAAGGEEADAS